MAFFTMSHIGKILKNSKTPFITEMNWMYSDCICVIQNHEEGSVK